MKKTETIAIVLDEIRAIKADIKEVRNQDIPEIRRAFGNLREDFATIKERTSNTAKVISGIGVLISAVTAAVIQKFK